MSDDQNHEHGGVSGLTMLYLAHQGNVQQRIALEQLNLLREARGLPPLTMGDVDPMARRGRIIWLLFVWSVVLSALVIFVLGVTGYGQ